MDRISTTNLKDVLVINTNEFQDERGLLIKTYSESFFLNDIINLDFKETWFTKSFKDVIRAMHMQLGPKSCEKLVSVIQGAVLDVILDLRKDSSTYGKYFSIELNSELPKAIYIPVGCAHGYKVLENNTITMYMATETHDAQNDIGIRWDSFGFDWGINLPIVSQRDKLLPTFADYVP